WGLWGAEEAGGVHAVMGPGCRRSALFGYSRRKCDDIMLRGALDLFDPRQSKSATFTNVLGRLPRDESGVRHGLGCRRLDQQPCFEPALIAPDAAHFRMCIPRDHVQPCQGNTKTRRGTKSSDRIATPTLVARSSAFPR